MLNLREVHTIQVTAGIYVLSGRRIEVFFLACTPIDSDLLNTRVSVALALVTMS